MAETDPTAEDHLIDSPLKPGEPLFGTPGTRRDTGPVSRVGPRGRPLAVPAQLARHTS